MTKFEGVNNKLEIHKNLNTNFVVATVILACYYLDLVN